MIFFYHYQHINFGKKWLLQIHRACFNKWQFLRKGHQHTQTLTQNKFWKLKKNIFITANVYGDQINFWKSDTLKGLKLKDICMHLVTIHTTSLSLSIAEKNTLYVNHYFGRSWNCNNSKWHTHQTCKYKFI